MMFCILFITCFLVLEIEQRYYDRVLEEKQRLENGLVNAVEKTAEKLAGVMHDTMEGKQKVIEQEFFISLYSALGLMNDKEQQEKLGMYVPLIVLVEEDGASFFYKKEVIRDEIVELQNNWTEKTAFDFKEDMTNAERKVVVAEVLEEKASKIITEYNYIAEQYGIKYEFSVPRFLQNTSEILSLPMLFVVFQGWPLVTDGSIVYENCIDAGVYLQETMHYILELPQDLTRTCPYYHKEDCIMLSEIIRVEPEFVVTKEEAVRKYGAFPCTLCLP